MSRYQMHNPDEPVMFDWLAHAERVSEAKKLKVCEECGQLRPARVFHGVLRCEECEDAFVYSLEH